jgi:cytochrome b561
MTSAANKNVLKYPLSWRILHWIIAILVLTLVAVGIWMTQRAEDNVFTALTDTLYSMHKAIGFTVLLLMVVRLLVRLSQQAPPYPDWMSPRLQKLAAGLHHLLYLMLFVTPLLGWAGITAYPALGIAGDYGLPPMPGIAPNRELAETLLEIHGAMALILAVMIIGHIGAAVHHMLKKDGVVRRMV